MARTGRIRRMSEEDTDLNMVPIMNMFMVLIPFLLMSASFMHIKAINTSIPIHRSAPMDGMDDMDKKEEARVTVILTIGEKALQLSAISDMLESSQLADFETTIQRTANMEEAEKAILNVLKDIKRRYPVSDTMVLVPDETVLYEEIVHTMDMARNLEEDTLFPNVVLSASLG